MQMYTTLCQNDISNFVQSGAGLSRPQATVNHNPITTDINTNFIPFNRPSYSPASTTTLYFVPSGSGPGSSTSLELNPSSSSASKGKGKRRLWSTVETNVLVSIYEDFYIDGSLSSKTSKENGPKWEELTSQVNKSLAERNIAPRSLHQIKEKINNLKAEYK